MVNASDIALRLRLKALENTPPLVTAVIQTFKVWFCSAAPLPQLLPHVRNMFLCIYLYIYNKNEVAFLANVG